MLGLIGIKRHKISCIIGVLPHERLTEQHIYVDVEVRFDFSKCIASNHVRDTVNYVTLSELSTQLAVERKYHLLEAYANDLLNVLYEKFDIAWARVRIEKPLAIPTAEAAVVELQRQRSEVIL